MTVPHPGPRGTPRRHASEEFRALDDGNNPYARINKPILRLQPLSRPAGISETVRERVGEMLPLRFVKLVNSGQSFAGSRVRHRAKPGPQAARSGFSKGSSEEEDMGLLTKSLRSSGRHDSPFGTRRSLSPLIDTPSPGSLPLFRKRSDIIQDPAPFIPFAVHFRRSFTPLAAQLQNHFREPASMNIEHGTPDLEQELGSFDVQRSMSDVRCSSPR